MKKRTAKKPASQRTWALSDIAASILVWLFYEYAVPHLSHNVQSGFRNWLPASTVNECLVWVICALGLNIVVGYAGLLDLGFVAFWAIGGYSAGWFMSNFFYQVNLRFGSVAPKTLPGIHLSIWIVLLLAGLICAFFGIIIGAPTLRLKSDYLALVTLGLFPRFSPMERTLVA